MKRLMCLLLIVTIAPAGCADKKKIELKTVAVRRGWFSPAEYKSNAVLVKENARLRMELSKARQSQSTVSILNNLYELGADVLDKIAEVRVAVRDQPKAVKSAERAIEAQRVTIEVLQKVCRLYEDAMSSQRATIEILKKMCRLYDNEPYLEG